MVLNYEVGSGVLIHEMGHVIGVQHLAEVISIQMSLNLLTVKPLVIPPLITLVLSEVYTGCG